MIRCRNGEIVRAKNFRGRYIDSEYFMRQEILRSCRQIHEPFCSDKSDVTPETCSWACSHSGMLPLADKDGQRSEKSWPCPGEARCIARSKICDGVRDCGNGQDEDSNLCTEEFCRNGYVSTDSNKLDFKTWTYGKNVSKLSKSYIFLDYRYANVHPKNIHDHLLGVYHASKLIFESDRQNYMTPKCNHSTKCLRRDRYENSENWIEC